MTPTRRRELAEKTAAKLHRGAVSAVDIPMLESAFLELEREVCASRDALLRRWLENNVYEDQQKLIADTERELGDSHE